MDEQQHAHKIPDLRSVLIHAIDHAAHATSCLDLAYDTSAVLERGVKEKSWKHVEAACVLLDYFCQQRLDTLICDMGEVAEWARILEGAMTLKPALREREN